MHSACRALWTAIAAAASCVGETQNNSYYSTTRQGWFDRSSWPRARLASPRPGTRRRSPSVPREGHVGRGGRRPAADGDTGRAQQAGRFVRRSGLPIRSACRAAAARCSRTTRALWPLAPRAHVHLALWPRGSGPAIEGNSDGPPAPRLRLHWCSTLFVRFGTY